MGRILDYSKLEYCKKNRQFGSFGYWAALGALAYPFLLFLLSVVLSYVTLRLSHRAVAVVSHFTSLSLMLVCLLSLFFGVLALRADGRRAYVGGVVSVLAACVNFLLFCLTGLV